MGDVIDLASRAKRVPPPMALDHDDLVAAVENRLQAQRAHGVWRLNKRVPLDKQDIATLARNLAAMRERLPHGAKSEVLGAARFAGGANPSTYVNNLCLPPAVGEQLERRMRRLTPEVQRYVDVAVAIEGDRHRAIAYLFRGTSLDRTSPDDWSSKLSWHLDHLAQRVAVDTDLARYFDEISASNVCAAEGEELSFRLTSWLSETFHKTDFAEARHEHPNGTWLYDRTEDLTPKRGAPLFVPMVEIDRFERAWAVRPVGGEGPSIACVFRSTLSLAIVPVATTLDEPCRVECWLLERPTASMMGGRKGVWQAQVDRSAITIRTDEQSYEPTDSVGFLEWSRTEEGRLFVENAAESGLQADLLCGGWWSAPASSGLVQARLSAPRRKGRTIAVPGGRRIEGIVSDPSESEEVNYNLAAPDVFPPHGSLALELTFGLTLLESAFRQSAEKLVAQFRAFRREVSLASPLCE